MTDATTTLYGIRNCDTMKKAFSWLDSHGVAYRFHDYRKSGASPETVAAWCDKLGWQALVNTRGTTWRKLDPSQQTIDSSGDAVALMVAHPSLIRRPVIETAAGEILVGFDPERYEATFALSGASA